MTITTAPLYRHASEYRGNLWRLTALACPLCTSRTEALYSLITRKPLGIRCHCCDWRVDFYDTNSPYFREEPGKERRWLDAETTYTESPVKHMGSLGRD